MNFTPAHVGNVQYNSGDVEQYKIWKLNSGKEITRFYFKITV